MENRIHLKILTLYQFIQWIDCLVLARVNEVVCYRRSLFFRLHPLSSVCQSEPSDSMGRKRDNSLSPTPGTRVS